MQCWGRQEGGEVGYKGVISAASAVILIKLYIIVLFYHPSLPPSPSLCCRSNPLCQCGGCGSLSCLGHPLLCCQVTISGLNNEFKMEATSLLSLLDTSRCLLALCFFVVCCLLFVALLLCCWCFCYVCG